MDPFFEFCRRELLLVDTDEALEIAGLEYLDWAFLTEPQLDHCAKLLEALTVH